MVGCEAGTSVHVPVPLLIGELKLLQQPGSQGGGGGVAEVGRQLHQLHGLLRVASAARQEVVQQLLPVGERQSGSQLGQSHGRQSQTCDESGRRNEAEQFQDRRTYGGTLFLALNSVSMSLEREGNIQPRNSQKHMNI